MRRPRWKLEVSTFPFLAVLLCAMGALLLLLFIMDRRAKIAAQHTASEAVAERQKRTQDEEDARQAEWQKAKDLLHQTLLDQQNELLGDSKGVQQYLDAASDKLAVARSQHRNLDDKVNREESQIAALQAQLVNQRANLKDVDLKDRKAKAELLEAAKELAELERAFQKLRKLKENEKQVYSVVPYRGKHGQARPPIYVECVRSGVVFHPEKKMFDGWDFTPESLKAEVERRTGTLAAEKSAKEKSRTIAEERKGPYVLFLVRPAGIETYYKAQAGLKGYDLDFGYELVDEDWVLDFNGDPNAKPAPPNSFAKTGEPKKSIAAPPQRIGSGAAGQGNSGLVVPPPQQVGSGTAWQGSSGSIERPSTNLAPPVVGGAERPPLTSGNPSYGGGEPGVQGKGSAFVPIAKLPSPTPIASSPGNPLAKPDGAPSLGNSGPSGFAPPGIPSPGQNVGGKSNGAANSNPSGPSEPGQNVGDKSNGTAKPNPGGEAGEPGGKSSGRANPNPGGEAGEPGGKSMPSFGGDNAKKAAPTPPISRMLGNRDFVITIDCYTDHATVFPSGCNIAGAGQMRTLTTRPWWTP